MNLLKAEDMLKDLLPNATYLAYGTVGKEQEGENSLFNYLNLKTLIFEAKMNTNVLPLEHSLELLKKEKQFYTLDILPTLYKEHVSEENIEYCKNKLEEIENEIAEIENALKEKKGTINI